MPDVRQPISFVATGLPDAARAFYGDRLGLTLVECSPHALVFDDGGQMLRVQIVAGFTPAAHTVHGWQVPDISQQMRRFASRGVSFLTFDQLDQDASGVWQTPGGDKIAWFHDPDGNILSLTQFADD